MNTLSLTHEQNQILSDAIEETNTSGQRYLTILSFLTSLMYNQFSATTPRQHDQYKLREQNKALEAFGSCAYTAGISHEDMSHGMDAVRKHSAMVSVGSRFNEVLEKFEVTRILNLPAEYRTLLTARGINTGSSE